MDMVTCEVWIMVTESGTYEVSTDPADMQADAGEACRFVKVTVKVPKPQPLELVATIAAEPATGELTAV